MTIFLSVCPKIISPFSDDKGEKRLLYEELEVSEYWIVDVQNVQVIAFAIENKGSRRITQSQVLPGLAISLLEEAFRRTRQITQDQVVAWLLDLLHKSEKGVSEARR